MSGLDLDAMLEARRRATAGEWLVDDESYDHISVTVETRHLDICTAWGDGRHDNSEFIALAANKWEEMCGELKELRARNDQLEKSVVLQGEFDTEINDMFDAYLPDFQRMEGDSGHEHIKRLMKSYADLINTKPPHR